MRWIINWVLSAAALLLVAHLVPGVYVTGLMSALAAAFVIGLVNATLGAVLKLITFPFTVLSLAAFLARHQRLNAGIGDLVRPRLSRRGILAGFLGSDCPEPGQHVLPLAGLVRTLKPGAGLPRRREGE